MVVSTDQMDMNQGFGSSTMSVSYVTRRGTNRFTGRLYEGYRSQLFDATNWGSTVKPKYHRNDFGASLGGPIVRDKIFFFASMASLAADLPSGIAAGACGAVQAMASAPAASASTARAAFILVGTVTSRTPSGPSGRCFIYQLTASLNDAGHGCGRSHQHGAGMRWFVIRVRLCRARV